MDDTFIHHFYLRIGDVEYTITPLGIAAAVGLMVFLVLIVAVVVRRFSD